MDHCPAKLDTMGQLYPECISDTKSRFWQIGNQSLSRTEVICPQPRRAARVSCIMDNFNRSAPRPPKGILPIHRGELGLEILDIFLIKDESDGDPESGNQASFFCGSPPVRANNPVVRDAQFAKQTHLLSSPLGNSKPRVERGSPSCGSSFGGSPKVRIEGFACGNSESRCVVRALA